MVSEPYAPTRRVLLVPRYAPRARAGAALRRGRAPGPLHEDDLYGQESFESQKRALHALVEFARAGSAPVVDVRYADLMRDAVATKSINQIFSPDRREIAEDMRQAIQAKAGNRIEVVDVFVRDIQAPPRVREAIEARIEREQQVEQERFQTEIIQERAQQAIEEARGIAEAQKIISEGLTPAYLTFHYIEQLGTLPAGSVVYVPTEGGVPLMRSVGGGN